MKHSIFFLLAMLLFVGGCSDNNQEKMNLLLDEYVKSNNQSYINDLMGIAHNILLENQKPLNYPISNTEKYHFDTKTAQMLIERGQFEAAVLLYKISSNGRDKFLTDELFQLMNTTYKGDDPRINYFIAIGLKSHNHLKSSYYRASKAGLKDPGVYGDDIVTLLDHYGCSFEADVWKELSIQGDSDLLPEYHGENYPKQPNKSLDEILVARKQIRFGQIPELTDKCPITQYD